MTEATIPDDRLDPFRRRPPARLYHYSSPAGLLGIAKSGTLWATDARFLNDARELKHARSVTRQVLAHRARSVSDVRLLQALIRFSPSTPLWRQLLRSYVASLSEHGDLLSQWRAYCPRSGGFALGFTAPDLRRTLRDQGYVLAPCIYDESTQQAIINKCVDIALKVHSSVHSKRKLAAEADETAELVFATLVSDYAPLLKHPSFSEEKEWRVIPKPRSPRLSSPLWNRANPPASFSRALTKAMRPTTRQAIEYRTGTATLIPFTTLSLRGDSGRMPLSRIVVGPSRQIDLSVEATKGFVAQLGLKDTLVARSRCTYRAE